MGGRILLPVADQRELGGTGQLLDLRLAPESGAAVALALHIA
jgi:hypothetical protein